MLLDFGFATPLGTSRYAEVAWSHIFRLRLRSCANIFGFGSGSGSEFFSNLRIRLLFKLRQPSMQPKFSNACT